MTRLRKLELLDTNFIYKKYHILCIGLSLVANILHNRRKPHLLGLKSLRTLNLVKIGKMGRDVLLKFGRWRFSLQHDFVSLLCPQVQTAGGRRRWRRLSIIKRPFKNGLSSEKLSRWILMYICVYIFLPLKCHFV